MKSTYKLLGLIWDGRQCADSLPLIRPFDVRVTPLGEPDSLFDGERSRRVVRLSRMLRLGSEEELERILCLAKRADVLFLLVDYAPCTASMVSQDFYRHRLLQIVGTFETDCPATTVYLMASPSRTVLAA